MLNGTGRSVEEILKAGAERELLWTRQHARLRYPFEPLYREIYNFQKVSPVEHITNLRNFLTITKYLAPKHGSYLNRRTLRHPDLQPNNIIISDSFDIKGLIDWQHCSILPLFLQAKPPKYFQNYGDEESENLIEPRLPQGFETFDSDEKAMAHELYRRRHTHFHYISATEKLNEDHFNACQHPEVVLKQKLFEHATNPWEGDSVTLKADLIRATQRWPELLCESDNNASLHPCPLSYEQEEIDKCFEIKREQDISDRDMENSRLGIGVGEDGWVEPQMYEIASEKAELFKEEVLRVAEPEEREMIERHWPFADRDEDE